MNILYEDNHIIAVEKPVNIPVQADSSGDDDMLTLLKGYIKQKYDNPVEQRFHDDLYGYLRTLDLVDERMPEAPDLDDLWFKIGQSYMTDGIREYNTGYPSVALGWMMFIGMAVAMYWDVEWEVYGKVPDLYLYLRDRIDFDHMDDYILDKVLCLDADSRKKMNDAVAESASRTYNMMSHMCLELKDLSLN